MHSMVEPDMQQQTSNMKPQVYATEAVLSAGGVQQVRTLEA